MIWILMLYLVVVAGFVAIAATFAERTLRELRMPARWVWIVAMAGCMLCIVWSPVSWSTVQRVQIARGSTAAGATDGTASLIARTVGAIHPATATIEAASRSDLAARIDLVLLIAWLACSAATLAMFGVGAMRLRRMSRAATHAQLCDVPVLVTSDIGPMTLGMRRPRIVVPRWLTDLDVAAQRLVLLHESEHARRADPALLIFGGTMTVVMPWNPLMWYMLRRLRQAVEIDCDNRVLRRYPDRHAYATLLLSIAGRPRSTLLPIAGLRGSRSTLERRVLEMKYRPTSRRVALTVACSLSAIVVATTAMTVPRPERDSLAPSTATMHSNARTVRATGRFRVTPESGVTSYRIYSPAGAFGNPGQELRVRSDTMRGTLGDRNETEGLVLDIDVTDGPIYIVSDGPIALHVEVALFGASPAPWQTATARKVIVAKDGIYFREPPHGK